MSKKVVIIDYQLGNLFSVYQACLNEGIEAKTSSEKKTVEEADALILPGVGAFGDAMLSLKKYDLIEPIRDFAASGRPLFGICLGLQLLFSESEEFGSFKGLDLVKGTVKKFPTSSKNRGKVLVPQIAWNQIQEKKSWKTSPLQNLKNGEFMYFVHSYYVCPDTTAEILSQTSYADVTYCSSISKNNIFATQFHPEKSAKEGLKIYKNWIEKI